MPSDAVASRLAVVMIALLLLRSHYYGVESRDNTTLLCPPSLSTIKTLMKQHTKGGNTVSYLTYFLSLSLKGLYSFLKSDLGAGGCVQTSLCRENEIPDFGTGTGAFTAMPKGGIRPQLTWYQHWRRLWEPDKNVNTFQKSIVSYE